MIDLTGAGLMIGLEIHQQAGRVGDRKLFCNCKADIIERHPNLSVARQLRASAGETGALDAAAAQEQAKGKRYVYQAFSDANCLVELDEEPPHPVNNEVVTTAVMVAKACGSTILPKVQFMRKTIVDGSATSGFQRTGLFALGGTVPECDPVVRLQTICIEEDAAKIVTRTPDEDVYNLSRLGIPLIEIATEPDITTAQQAQAVAAQLGMILRSTKRVKRGLGTIRQDINVSVTGGTRVEIKGAQDLRLLPTIVENEALRQQGLVKLKDELAGKQLTLGASVDVTVAFAQSKVGFVKNALAKGDHAIGVLVPEFSGLFKRELCPNYRVGSELADLARVRGFGGLIHSDEDLAKYGLLGKTEVDTMLGAKVNDGFIVLIGDAKKINFLISDALAPRLRQFQLGVPKEVRKANPDGTSSFLRTMPGAARMYPETDIPVVVVNTEDIHAPKLFTEQVRELQKAAGINEEQAKLIVREGIQLLEYIERFPSIDAAFIANATLNFGKEILARNKKEIDHIALLEPLFDAVHRKKIPKSAVFEILVEIAEGKTSLVTVDYGKYSQMTDDVLRAIVQDTLRENAGLRPNALMGKVMAKARGKADGARVMALIEEEAGKLL